MTLRYSIPVKVERKCPWCYGTGEFYRKECHHCLGTGKVERIKFKRPQIAEWLQKWRDRGGPEKLAEEVGNEHHIQD